MHSLRQTEDDFRLVLENEKLQVLFKIFLLGEDNLENLTFWIMVEEFKSIEANSKKKKKFTSNIPTNRLTVN